MPTYIAKLTSHNCRMVLGDPRDMMFCGEPTVHGSSWCQSCYTVVFGRSQPPAFAKLPIRLPVDLVPRNAPPELVVEPPAPELEEVMAENE